MAGLTVQDILTRVQRLFGDEAQVQLTQADVTRWINDAMREIVAKSNLLQVKGTIDSVVNQSAYNLPTGILRLNSVRYNGLALTNVTLQEVDEMIGSVDQTIAQGYPTGTPQVYWIWAGQINLYPAPNSALTGGLAVYYTRQPNDVVNLSDVPELPTQYHNRIVEYCMAQAYDMDENFFVAMLKRNTFDAGVQELKADGDWQNQETYPFITDSAADVGADYYYG